jgi:carotenoid cleavage dioxygenase-like enzyme
VVSWFQAFAFLGRVTVCAATPWELDEDTLETKGSCDFDGKLPFYVPFTAHPKVAPGSGELMFFGFNPVYPPHCSVGSLTPEVGLYSETRMQFTQRLKAPWFQPW